MRTYKKTITCKVKRQVVNVDGEMVTYEYVYEKPNPYYKNEE